MLNQKIVNVMPSCLTFMDVITGYEENPNYDTKGRIVFGLHDVRMNYSDRKEELEKVNSFRKVVLVHLIMILYPEAAYKDAVNKNKTDVVNNWMIPTFKAMKIGRIKAKNIDSDFEESDARKVRDSLRYDHDWRKFIVNVNFLDAMYAAYIYYLDKLMFKYKSSGVDPLMEDFYRVFDYISNEIKDIKKS